jgi:hypothetical protein
MHLNFLEIKEQQKTKRIGQKIMKWSLRQQYKTAEKQKKFL